jgi:hypothetical protein
MRALPSKTSLATTAALCGSLFGANAHAGGAKATVFGKPFAAKALIASYIGAIQDGKPFDVHLIIMDRPLTCAQLESTDTLHGQPAGAHFIDINNLHWKAGGDIKIDPNADPMVQFWSNEPRKDDPSKKFDMAYATSGTLKVLAADPKSGKIHLTAKTDDGASTIDDTLSFTICQ